MIACLQGELFYKSPERLIINVGGVGYEVFISQASLSRLPETGKEIFLYTYTDVREDALNLYGFERIEEKEIFIQLIGVSGVGPKLAITILSGIGPAELARAIVSEDIHRLVQISGVGKKTAERLCLELKDKVQFIPEQQLEESPSGVEPEAHDDRLAADVISALVNLGYSEVGARKALDAIRRQLPKETYSAMPLEELLRRALRAMA